MDKIAVLDFGGQYAHLIANRIRRVGVYSEIFDGDITKDKLVEYKGIILSGGPASVTGQNSIHCDMGIFDLGVPILGICYGHQLIGYSLGGEVEKGAVKEYGPARLTVLEKKGIFENISDDESVWMSHFDQVTREPEGFTVTAKTEDCPIAAMADYERNIYSTQFHPEVTHTSCGMTILENFVEITGAKREWDISAYIERITEEIKQKVGNKKVFLMISGGVDSTVAFLLIAKAIGEENVYGLFVDTGFMRLNERAEVEAALRKVGVKNLHVYDASNEYFEALKGIYEPEEKRQIIGNLFLEIQQKVSDDLKLNPEEWMLGQGTIYPDTIETGGTKHADKIKTHHNRVERVRELIEAGKVIEPLSQLYKDEVRKVGELLGLNSEMIWRHPFPGPGLAVRCLCAKGPDVPANVSELEKQINEITSEKGFKARVLPIKSVGVQGDERTYRHPVLLLGELNDWEEIDNLATRLTNQFNDVNRVLLALDRSEVAYMEIPDFYLSKERILTTQKADKVVMDYLKEAKIDQEIWQCPTVLLPLVLDSPSSTDGSVQAKKECIVVRPVCSAEAMTANFYRMEEGKLNELAKRLGELGLFSGIFYDLTNKPPGTIEWE